MSIGTITAVVVCILTGIGMGLTDNDPSKKQEEEFDIS